MVVHRQPGVRARRDEGAARAADCRVRGDRVDEQGVPRFRPEPCLHARPARPREGSRAYGASRFGR